MFSAVLKRMFSNRWMTACLLTGFIISTALVSSIPVYSDGILQRMLIKDLESLQVETGTFPGTYQGDSSLFNSYKPADRMKAFNFFTDRLNNDLIADIGLPIIDSKNELTLPPTYLIPQSSDAKDVPSVNVEVSASTDFEKHVKLINGRMYSSKGIDGIYEVMVTEEAMKNLGLALEKVYDLESKTDTGVKPIKVKVVGVYTKADDGDPYWNNDFSRYSKRLVMHYDSMLRDILESDSSIMGDAQWYYALDYHKITINDISRIIETLNGQLKWSKEYTNIFTLSIPAYSIMEKYISRAAQLKVTLWILTVPIFIMLIFYTFMVSQLIVRHDENEIAILKSRGADVSQILVSYLAEGGIISLAALAVGPPLGLLLCDFIGSSNGFLEFVQRVALPIGLSSKAYAYSLASVSILIITMLVPVYLHSRISIVQHKQGKVRNRRTSIWKKFFLDLVCLAVSGYGLYRYNQTQKILSITGAKGTEVGIDPLMFLTSTLFVLGSGLLFLRVYPYIVRFIFLLGRKIWPPVIYASLIQVGRSKGQEQFFMLFIILAVSTGFFNANAARTINGNIEDKISYGIGADVTLMAQWESNQPKGNGRGRMSQGGGGDEEPTEPLRYFEPDYSKYSNLSGIEQATKVLVQDAATIRYGNTSTGNIKLMGIIPNEFAEIAWYRKDLMKHHLIEYTNLMTGVPKAFLLSSNLKDKYRLKVGDTIFVRWNEQSYLEGTVYAFVDYWPTYNPNSIEKGKEAPGLIVANLSYIQSRLALEPYQVWIKKKPGVPDKQINDDIIQKKLPIDFINYTNQQLIKMKNDPMLQGTNGSLTLGFVTAMIISMLGFLIYWIISIQARVLNFGILRAMGVARIKIIGMLAFEQLLISGTAIFIAVIIGGITGDLFIPLLQIIYSSAEQVPSFRIMADSGDYIKIYTILAGMLAIGLFTLWKIVSHIKIDQALKLGED